MSQDAHPSLAPPPQGATPSSTCRGPGVADSSRLRGEADLALIPASTSHDLGHPTSPPSSVDGDDTFLRKPCRDGLTKQSFVWVSMVLFYLHPNPHPTPHHLAHPDSCPVLALPCSRQACQSLGRDDDLWLLLRPQTSPPPAVYG